MLAQSPRSGPLALQQCAAIGSGVDLRFARHVATLALTRLSAADFRRDVQPLLDEHAMVGELVLRSARAIAALRDDEVEVLAAFLPNDYAQSFRHFAATLRDERMPGIPQRLSVALERCWDENLRSLQAQSLKDLRNEINESALGIPAPGPGMKMPDGAVDLGGAYNAPLAVVFGQTPQASNCVAQLATNLQHIAGHDFDVRGVVLTAPPGVAQGVPMGVQGIAIGRSCKRLHFLHGALNAESLRKSQNVAEYQVNYQDGASETVDVIAGRDITSTYVPANAPADPPRAAWEGDDTRGLPLDGRIRLYVQTWVNPRPDAVIRSVDMLDGHTRAMPFLVAITAE